MTYSQMRLALRDYSLTENQLRQRWNSLQIASFGTFTTQSLDDEERRMHPEMGGTPMTFYEMRHCLSNLTLTEAELVQHWNNLQPIPPDSTNRQSQNRKQRIDQSMGVQVQRIPCEDR